MKYPVQESLTSTKGIVPAEGRQGGTAEQACKPAGSEHPRQSGECCSDQANRRLAEFTARHGWATAGYEVEG